MRTLTLVGLLASLAACESYTDQTSPCLGRGNKQVVSRNDTAVQSFLPSQNSSAFAFDCAYRPLGDSE